jgi:hypothetical protein
MLAELGFEYVGIGRAAAPVQASLLDNTAPVRLAA